MNETIIQKIASLATGEYGDEVSEAFKRRAEKDKPESLQQAWRVLDEVVGSSTMNPEPSFQATGSFTVARDIVLLPMEK